MVFLRQKTDFFYLQEGKFVLLLTHIILSRQNPFKIRPPRTKGAHDMTTTTALALLLATLSIGVHQVEGVMIKKYNSKHNVGGFIFTALISLFAMIFFFITDKNGLCFPPLLILYGVISGIFFCTASFLTYVAFGCGSFVLSNLFLSYSLLFSVGYGLFVLKESATVMTYIGLALMMISVFLVKSKKKQENDIESEKVKISFKWVVCIVLSVIGSGMFGVMQKLQQVQFAKAYDNEFMIVTYAFTVITLMAIGIIMDGKNLFYILRHGGLYAAFAGMSNGATNFLNLVVNAMIPISIAAPTRSGIKIVISFLISLVIFKERLTKKQVAGVIFGAAALILLNLKI